MASVASKFMPDLFRLMGAKKLFNSAEATRRHIAQQQLRPASYGPPKSLDRTVDLRIRRVQGWPVYEVSPRGPAPLRRAIYLHGGGWMNEIVSFQWQLIAELARATATQFTVPIYPLVPIGSAATVVPVATDLTAELVAEVGPEHTTLLGDSSGGTIALAVAQQLRNRGLPAPHRTILISPVLDLSFRDPALAEFAPRDPMLAVPGLQASAELWRGELPVDDPLVSPLNGDLSGLAPITLFSGTRDLVHPDARRLVRRAQEAGLSVDYHGAPQMLHGYPMLPIPEGRRVMQAALTTKVGGSCFV